jgi:hypothetical protein
MPKPMLGVKHEIVVHDNLDGAYKVTKLTPKIPSQSMQHLPIYLEYYAR